MKECKYSKILPCYRDGYGVWHYSDDTHDKVYELNKQMCDIDQHLSEAGYFGMICEGQVETRKKLKDMKEKKTKKMTKAEAFEYLKGKRAVCDVFNNEGVQRKFFEVGMKWRGGSTNVTEDIGCFIFVDLNGCLTHCNSRAWFDTHEYEEISADDILSIEIVDDKKDDERKGEILDEIAKLGEKISDLLEEYGGDVIVEIDLFDVILRNSGDILYRK